jgi:hypothetical protein
VFGEGREVEIKGEAFTDRFQPYEVHVYRGTGSSSQK